jgi:hypothetical protein
MIGKVLDTNDIEVVDVVVLVASFSEPRQSFDMGEGDVRAIFEDAELFILDH